MKLDTPYLTHELLRLMKIKESKALKWVNHLMNGVSNVANSAMPYQPSYRALSPVKGVIILLTGPSCLLQHLWSEI